MTWIQIIVLIVGGVAFLAVCFAVWGMLSPGPDYIPMSPDEEYRWLITDQGLSHEEAMEIMDMRQTIQ